MYVPMHEDIKRTLNEFWIILGQHWSYGHRISTKRSMIQVSLRSIQLVQQMDVCEHQIAGILKLKY